MAETPNDSTNLKSILEWYRDAGVDMAVGETPVNQFEAAQQAARAKVQALSSSQPAVKASSRPTTPAQPATDVLANSGEHAKAAAEIAAAADTLEALEAALRDFDGCALKLRATQLVFADGNPDADIMLIGEAPGRDEDLQGKPFVGRSGMLLDRMLAAIGLDRTRVYIANTVPWRPPGNRTPTPDEIATCLPFLHRQIGLVSPKLIMTLGAPAAQTLFDTKEPISRMRGRWRDAELGGLQLKAMPTLHPAYLLRQPAQKALAWRDMLALKQAARELGLL